MDTTGDWIRKARALGAALPGFNIPYLPMMEPVVRAIRDADALGLVMVARLEWEKFAAVSPRAVRDEYARVGDPAHTRLHLDHVPVIDEDNKPCDYRAVIADALDLGYDSVMIDGSRLSLDDNIRCTAEVVAMARPYRRPVEAELGAIPGHEAGPLPPYEELFARRHGFTLPGEARRFINETGADWLSVAAGNLHGAIADATRAQAKPAARLDLALLGELARAAAVPLVLHGGTGIPADIVRQAFARGIAKINIATAIRQPYERVLADGGATAAAQQAVYATTKTILIDDLGLAGLRRRLGA